MKHRLSASSSQCRSSKSVKICVDPWLNSFRKIEIARFVIRNKALPKCAEASVLDLFPGLPHQVEIEMQIVQRDQAKSEDLLGLDEMPNVTTRESQARGTSAIFFDRTLVPRKICIF